MSKRANGEGTVYRQGERWIGEVVLDDKRRRVSGTTRNAAALRLREMIGKHDKGQVIVDGHASVRTLVEQWQSVELASRRDELAPGTFKRFEWHARLLIDNVGEARLRTLAPERIEAMYAQLAAGKHGGKALGRASLISLRSTLNQVLTFGVRRGVLDRNIATVTIIPREAKREQPKTSLTGDEARTLWAACAQHERLGAMWQVGLMTGLRPGELAGLLWSSVDLDSASPSLTISRNVQIDRRGRAMLVDGVKTDGSYRTIGLAAPLVPVLRAHRAAQVAERLAATSWAHDDLVFTTGSGATLSPGNVRRDLGKFCDELGLPDLNSNELRHTAASLMVDAGMTLEQVAGVLGHNSTRMLEMHYRHRLRPVITDHVAPMSSIFGGIS